MRISSRLYKGCTSSEEREDRKKFIGAHAPMLKLLLSIIESDINDARNSQESSDYSDASWAYKQADYVGTVRAYTHMRDILTISEDSHD